MSNINTSTTISKSMQTYYDRKVLMNAKPNLVFYEYGQKVVVPKNHGKVVQFRKWTPFDAVDGALTEGVIPEGQSLTMTEVTAELNQYGGYVAVTDILDLTAIDPVVNDSVELMGDQGGLTIDTLIRDELLKGDKVQYAGDATQRSEIVADDVLTVEDIRKAVRTLKNNKAPQFVRDGKGYYVAVVGPNTTFDLQSDPVWQDVSKYANTEQLFTGEIGKLFGVIFVESSQAAVATEGDVPVGQTLVFGKNAYGVIELEGGNLKSIIKPRGSAGTSDPLDQISTVGWKVDGFAAKILQPMWMVRIEHGLSA